eukprot:gene23024-27858_t
MGGCEHEVSEITYLLDARHGAPNGYFANTILGPHWTNLYIDYVSVPVNWASLPDDRWSHVVLESDALITDNINFMSRVHEGDKGTGCLK